MGFNEIPVSVGWELTIVSMVVESQANLIVVLFEVYWGNKILSPFSSREVGTHNCNNCRVYPGL